MTEADKHKEIMEAIEKIATNQASWNKAHEELDNERFKTIMTPDQLVAMMEDTMKKVFFGVGRGTYFWIKVLAVVVTSLAVIGGGFKFILGLLGFKQI